VVHDREVERDVPLVEAFTTFEQDWTRASSGYVDMAVPPTAVAVDEATRPHRDRGGDYYARKRPRE
jgi:hypothetical protein